MESSLLGRTFQTSLQLDACIFKLNFGIEHLQLEVFLLDYTFGEWAEVRARGVIKLRFVTETFSN